jgi:hypothetical protein
VNEKKKGSGEMEGDDVEKKEKFKMERRSYYAQKGRLWRELLGQKYIVVFIINLLCKSFHLQTATDLQIRKLNINIHFLTYVPSKEKKGCDLLCICHLVSRNFSTNAGQNLLLKFVDFLLARKVYNTNDFHIY